MEPEKTSNSQSNPEKENQSWKHHNLGLQDVLQSYNHLRGALVAQLVEHPILAQVISQFVSLSPMSDSVLTAWCLESASDSVCVCVCVCVCVSPSSAHSLSLSQK